MGKDFYKIGEAAKILATSIRTIRYYEEESLVIPTRTEKGTRLYSKPHIQRLRAILELTRSGFSIDTIRHIGNLRDQCATGRESSHKLSKLFDETIADLAKQIEVLENIKGEMQSAQKVILSCNECNNHPSTKGCPNCAVIQSLDELILLNLVWDTAA